MRSGQLMRGLTAGLFLCVFCSWQSSQATTYNVSDAAGTLSVSGTITTDGAIGPLITSDIQSWSLTITGFDSPPTLTPGNSVDSVTGNDLVASGSDLRFNYGDTSTGEFRIDLTTCCEVIAWQTQGLVGTGLGHLILFIQSGRDSNIGFAERTGDLIIAEATTAPLPATLPLFATGIGGLSLLGWRRKKKAAALAA